MINEKRDQAVAEAAVHKAVELKKKIAIGVDDDICLEAMLVRIQKVATDLGLVFTVKRASHGGVHVRFATGGAVYVFAADKLIGRPGN